jgi:hypothetical protein
VTTIRDWLETHAPGWLVGAWYFAHNRLTGVRCYAEGCGRLLLLHTPRQLNRCYDTPMALVITEKGLGRAVVAEAEEITQAAAT